MLRLSFVVLMVGACGSDLTADQACADVANARCAQLQMCSTADLAARWPDLATCEARDKLACTEALAAPNTGGTPTRVNTCASELTASTCDAFLSGVQEPIDCAAATGTVAAGAACAFAGQCASAFCAIADGSLCGVCATTPSPGASCATQGCGPTMICVKSTMLCQIPVAAAGACDRTLPCGQGLACVGATMQTMGSCMARVATAGATCDPRRMTGPDCSAAAGLACDTTSKTCVAQPLVAAGQPCGAVGTVDTGCAGGATCVIPTGGTTGTCIAPAADGAMCDATNGPACEAPAKCVSGTCQLPGSTSC